MLIERLKVARKYSIKLTWDALSAKKHASEEVLEIKKFKAYITGILESKKEMMDEEKSEKELVKQMANMQVEKK